MKNHSLKTVFIALLIVLHFLAFAQGEERKIVIDWQGIKTIEGPNSESVKALCGNGLYNNFSKNYTPEYNLKFALPKGISSCNILILNTEWEVVNDTLLYSLTYDLVPADTLSPEITTGTERGINMVMLAIVPIVRNPEGGIMRLKSFTLNITYTAKNEQDENLKSTTYASHSVLAQGNWYKIKLNETGIYRLTYSEIQSMGVNMAQVNPNTIRLFGNGGGMLPESNSVFRYDDLTENAIEVVTATTGTFAPGDYILFYGTSPDKLVYNKSEKKFEHSKNIYSDYTYYFLNFDGSSGKRIETEEQSTEVTDYISTSYLEGLFYENEHVNITSSGKDWLGERMDASAPVFELPEYTFKNLNPGKQAWIRYRVVAKAKSTTDFTVSLNGNFLSTASVFAESTNIFACEKTDRKSFFPDSDKLKIGFRYNHTEIGIGWLDWVELNVNHELKFTGGQMAFADPVSIAPGRITEFQLQSSNNAVTIWDVGDPVNVKRIQADFQDNISSFTLSTDSLRQFIAWDNTKYLSASFVEKVVNQDLHGIASADMLIVTHNDFIAEANRLAVYHNTTDGMKVSVVTNEQIYNEFSSGSPDVAGIRDFVRMLYTRPVTGKLRYLLLFGDGSYDYKDRLPGNTNRVPAFESKESLSLVYSFPTDDFYGELDPGEGNNASGLIDIGIGRFPVNDLQQAKNAVDKTIYYASKSVSTFGEWRNKVCLITDDGDQNTHFSQAENNIYPFLLSKAPQMNVDKLYLDAFVQTATPAGERCPEMTAAINTAIGKGALLVNYTGHGGEAGWADENILSIREIDAWTNYNNMPVFITATCEFSRYDDPAEVSAGEKVFLNPFGGAVAMFTTTRLANSATNIDINIRIYDTLLVFPQSGLPRFGDVITSAKNDTETGSISLIRNFTLLGDPALQLAYPQFKVVTTQINGHETQQTPDTISAMQPVDIQGIITDDAGSKLTSFNGILEIKVFDKARAVNTLGSEPKDWPAKFMVQDNFIYQGRATVSNGEFAVKFIAPRDIDYSYGPGKISYYAFDSTTDANGYYNEVIIGGSGNESDDQNGPQIELYFNDFDFNDGGVTGTTPLLIVKLNDESGISTVSSSIGHDIVATIDGVFADSHVLNSYYKGDLDSYQSGEIRFKMPELKPGMHTLTLKAWDVFNNSSEATIRFNVVENIQISITEVKVYPNPFKQDVHVEFEINLFDTPVEAYLEIFNINGSLVASTTSKSLVTNGYNAGTLTWNGLSNTGTAVPAGVYLIAVRVGNDHTETIKAVRLVKFR